MHNHADVSAEEARPGPRKHSLPAAALASLLVIVAFGNAAVYIAVAANPLVTSDSWDFIVLFLQKALDSGPDLVDFFMKRDAFDHAQPIVKALLWVNASWLGLDYVFEALAGLAFAVVAWGFLVATTRDVPRNSSLQRALTIGALAASMVTLNSGMLFNWSLVSLVFIAYLLAVMAAFSAWRALDTGAFGWLVISALLVAFLLDDVGTITGAALLGSVALATAKSREWRRGLVAAGIVVGAICAYQVIVRLVLDPLPAPPGHAMDSLAWLWSHRAEWPAMIQTIFGSTLAHINPLTHYFPDSADIWQAVLATVVVAAHLWFWWCALHQRWNAATFQAVVIMLMFYAFMAGVLYARVPVYGVNYLNEPRYVAFYLLSNVALVLMVMGRPMPKSTSRTSIVAAIALCVLMALQVPLSKFTWYESRFLHSYYHTMAAQMLELGEGRVPKSCVPLLTVCQMAPIERKRAVDFLRRHELNVFSANFIARYNLQQLVLTDGPDDDDMSASSEGD